MLYKYERCLKDFIIELFSIYISLHFLFNLNRISEVVDINKKNIEYCRLLNMRKAIKKKKRGKDIRRIKYEKYLKKNLWIKRFQD